MNLREQAAKLREDGNSHYRHASFSGIEYAGWMAAGDECHARANELERRAAANFVLKRFGTGEAVATGTVDDLNRYAADKGYRFKADRSLFGGYYVDGDGEAYLADVG